MTRICFFFILIFSACSHQKNAWQNLSSKEIEERMLVLLSKVCLSGEGKAKILYSSNKSFVSYSSLLKANEKEWALGIDVPLHGEETLFFNWSQYPEAPLSITGTMSDRLMESPFMAGDSPVFFEGLVSFFDWILYAQKEKSALQSYKCWGQSDTEKGNGYCQLNFKNSSSQKVVFKQENSKQYFMLPFGEQKWVVMSLDIEREKYFERIAFHVVENMDEKRLDEMDGMEFSVKSCGVR